MLSILYDITPIFRFRDWFPDVKELDCNAVSGYTCVRIYMSGYACQDIHVSGYTGVRIYTCQICMCQDMHVWGYTRVRIYMSGCACPAVPGAECELGRWYSAGILGPQSPATLWKAAQSHLSPTATLLVCADFVKYSHFTSEQSKSRERLTPLKGEELPEQISEPMSAFCPPFGLQSSLPSPCLYSMILHSSESWSLSSGPCPHLPSRHLVPNGTWIPAPLFRCLHASSRATQTSLKSWLCCIPVWPCEVQTSFSLNCSSIKWE